MGSYSETCGFSGMEISESDSAYVMLLRGPTYEQGHGPFDLFVPHSTLLKGDYNDYGYLRVDDDEAIVALFNKQTGLKLQNGDDFSLDMLDETGDRKLGENLSRYWINSLVFDRLGEIKPEFPYVYVNNESVKVSTITEALDLIEARDRADYEKFAVRIKEIHSDPESTERDRAMEMALLMMSMRQGSSTDRLATAYHTAMVELIQAGESWEGVLPAKRRNSILSYAASELRKKVVPSEGIGPQHGGHIASVQFANIILDVQKERAKDRYDEDEEVED